MEKNEKKPGVGKEEVDIDALLDKAVSENRKCSLPSCITPIMSFQYCICRKCHKAFCSAHSMPQNHHCVSADASNKPYEGPQQYAEASA